MAIPNYRIVLNQRDWDRVHHADTLAHVTRAEADLKIRADAGTRTIEIDYSYGDLNNVYRIFRMVIGGNRKSWTETYGTDAFKAEELARIEASRDALRAVVPPDVNPNTATGIDAPTPVAGALTDVLADAQGLCLGHSHDQAAAYQFLADAVEAPETFGLTGGMLFIEELPGVFQAEIDAYMITDPEPPWSAAAQAFFDRIAIDRHLDGETRLDAVLRKARAKNIRVFGIDSGEMSPTMCADGSYPEMRCANMNAFGKQVMDAAIEANPDRKYVAFCGAAHSNTHEGGIPGFSQIYNIPALRLGNDGTVTCHDEDRALRGMPAKAVQLFVDRYTMVLEREQQRARSPDNPNAAALKVFALQEAVRLQAAGDLPDFAALDAIGDAGERGRQRQAMLGRIDAAVGGLPAAGPWRQPPPPPPRAGAGAPADGNAGGIWGWLTWIVELVELSSG